MKLKKITSFLLILALTFSAATVSVSADWEVNDNGTFYFYENDYWRGWLEFTNGDKFYMDENGAMQTGWIVIDNGRYYLDSAGKMLKDGAWKINGVTYTFDEEGKSTDKFSEMLDEEGFYGLTSRSITELMEDGEVKLEDLKEFAFPSGNYTAREVANKCKMSLICLAEDGAVGLALVDGIPTYIAVFTEKNEFYFNSDFNDDNYTILHNKATGYFGEVTARTENDSINFFKVNGEDFAAAISKTESKITVQGKY